MNSVFPTGAPGLGAAAPALSLPLPAIRLALPRPLPPPLPPLLPPQLPTLSIGAAIGLAALFLGVDFALQIEAGIFAAVLRPSPAFRDLLFMQVRFASIAILLAFALRKASTSWREALPFTHFSGWILPPLVIAAAGLHILISEADNTLRWVMPPPHWLIDVLKSQHRAPVTAFLALVVMAPLTEELLCRGIMLGGMLRRYRARTAILVSAALFMFIHLNPYQFVTAFTFGILAGWVYVQTRSLWPCIIGHGLMNLSPALGAMGAFPWAIEGYSKPQDPGIVLFQPLWFDALGVALAALGTLWLYWTFRWRRPAPIPQANL